VLWLVILVALAIPLAAVILDSPVVRSLASRHVEDQNPQSGDVKQLSQKLETLETELEVVNREVAQLKENQQFLIQMLENPAAREPAKLPKPPA
jgi:TolA-binding protein